MSLTTLDLGEQRILSIHGRYEPLMAGWRALLPESVATLLRNKVDFLEVEGHAPIAAASADWAWRFVKGDGVLCPSAPVHYDAANPAGCTPWGPAARGAIVVALRGRTSFEQMARRAQAAGAVAVVVVDNSEKGCCDEVQLCLEGVGIGGYYLSEPPRVPAVLVPGHAGEVLCSGRDDLRAKLVRR